MDHVIGTCKDCIFWKRKFNVQWETTTVNADGMSWAKPGSVFVDAMETDDPEWSPHDKRGKILKFLGAPPCADGLCYSERVEEDVTIDARIEEGNDRLNTSEDFGCIHFKQKEQ